MQAPIDKQKHPDHEPVLLLSAGQTRIVGAFILIALGVVFLLGQAKLLNYGSNWWVIFLVIPGLALLWSALTTYQHTHALRGKAGAQVIAGAVLVLLSVIFVVDPTWSFTRGWTLDTYFPFLRAINWGQLWPWFLIVPGLALLYSAVRNRVAASGIGGAALVVVGLIFLLNISWNAVWPLVIVAFGVWLLVGTRPKQA
jgi:hypothetical protein